MLSPAAPHLAGGACPELAPSFPQRCRAGGGGDPTGNLPEWELLSPQMILSDFEGSCHSLFFIDFTFYRFLTDFHFLSPFPFCLSFTHLSPVRFFLFFINFGHQDESCPLLPPWPL